MKNLKRKFAAILTSSAILVGSQGGFTSSAFVDGYLVKSTLGSAIASTVPNIVGKILRYMIFTYERIENYIDVEKYKGFRTPQETMKELEKIVNNESEIKVYGQEKAKKQMMDALSGVTVRIDNLKRKGGDVKEIRGNIIYIIGKPGTGKTKMCYAISNAFLKHPEKTSIFCHSESITNESELGTQLFKTITTKDIGEKREKNVLGTDGLMPKDEETPLLKHLFNWNESVVIIDEYEKMKSKSAKPSGTMNFAGMNIPTGVAGTGCDNSADEILRSIASTGKYKFMNKEIDCSKTLFLITTNETKEELYSNFGYNGSKGGGVQRINVIEFDKLNLDCCRRIIDDMIKKIKQNLMNPKGDFKINKVVFPDETLQNMAGCIYSDAVKQARAKFDLEQNIYMRCLILNWLKM
mgnify:CR=1 FL=1